MNPRLSENELLLLLSAVEGKRHILEYGCGGSTVLMLRSTAETIVSVESDLNWINRLKIIPEVKAEVERGRLDLQHVDVGPVGAWGYPTDESARDRWSSYAQRPWESDQGERTDFVFVDGRFRVACAMAAIVHGKADLTIAVHDFWDREIYHPLLSYVECACRTDTLGVFFSKRRIDGRALRADLVRFSTMPS